MNFIAPSHHRTIAQTLTVIAGRVPGSNIVRREQCCVPGSPPIA